MSLIKLLTIRPDFTTEEHTVEQGETYPVLRDAVGGLIEPIDLTPTLTMYVNEEFLYSGQEVNPVASHLFRSAGATYDILGPVILTGGIDDEGETVGLSDVQLYALNAVVSLYKPMPTE